MRSPDNTEVVWMVAVYWRDEGSLGSVEMCHSLDRAKKRARFLRKLGYGTENRSDTEIHIIRHRKQVWVESTEEAPIDQDTITVSANG